MSWFFTSDWHAWHANIIKYCKRPFMSEVEKDLMDMADRGAIPATDLRISPASAKLMTDTIIDNTNAVVGEQDTLVHAGDLLFAPRDELFERVRELKRRIVCKNVILIWGNHDDSLWELYNLQGYYGREPNRWRAQSEELRKLFPRVYEQRMFNCDGQKIFVNHYPLRSWDAAHHGAWNLYGHVHNLYEHEDNGRLAPYDEYMLEEGFKAVLALHASDASPALVAELMKVAAVTKGIDLTLDIGVDNVSIDTPWGTPWSVQDIRRYMSKKVPLWESRQTFYKNYRPKSTKKA